MLTDLVRALVVVVVVVVSKSLPATPAVVGC
jgi:hypothetical protein